MYDRGAERLEATGNVRFWDEGLFLTGQRAEHEFQTEVTRVEGATFTILDAHGHGSAETARLTGRDLFRARGATYTTCDPGNESWVLEADSIRLDRVEDVGVGRNVWVKFHSVPIFYSPYLTFPLSDARKTGFLAPKLRVSDSTGLELTTPYYLNLAPNRDATIAARGMSDRGIQFQGEYRYLMPWGAGEVAAEYLPHDRQIGDDRAAVRFAHEGEFAPRLSTDLDVAWVSDDDYLEDLGTNLGVSRRRFLQRRGALLYTGRRWWLRGRLQDYQTIDETIAPLDRPYERLPQILAQTNFIEHNRRLNPAVRAEFVSFERSDGVTGTRIDLRPSVSFPMRSAGAFLVPRAAVRYTAYDLDDTPPGADDSPSRLLPVFSADAGLLFERDVTLGGRGMVQTLEPRVYYLAIPYEDQSDLPVFDTGGYTFSFAQLFRDDRFNGADRLGDANQVSLALTSRLLAGSSGRELVRASLGQIRYLRDRKVTLPGEARETDRESDLVGELTASPTAHWRALAGFQWSTSDERTDRSTLAIRYQPDARRVINAAYRFVRESPASSEDSVEQADISFAWPLVRNWRAVGRWNYALADGTTLESFAGLEYESCCWALRTVLRRYLSNDEGEHTNAVFVQLELKGLTGVGRRTVSFLERSIPGYENEF
jgi:LPS-assembly protein